VQASENTAAGRRSPVQPGLPTARDRFAFFRECKEVLVPKQPAEGPLHAMVKKESLRYIGCVMDVWGAR